MKKLTLIAVLLCSGTAFGWYDAFGVAIADMNFKVKRNITLHFYLTGLPTPAIDATKRRFLRSTQRTDKVVSACVREVEVDKNGQLQKFIMEAPLSPDVAKDLIPEKEYSHQGRLEIGSWLENSSYFRTMIVIYDSRNAPVKIINTDHLATPHLLSPATAEKLSSNLCD